MNETIIENAIADMANIDAECFSDYFAVALGGLLILSEILPFIKKSKCSEVVDEEVEENEERNIRPSLIHQSNGVLEMCLHSFKAKTK